MKIEYQPVYSQGELNRLLNDAQTYKDNQFVEALVYSTSQSVFMAGNMTDEAEPDKVSQHLHFVIYMMDFLLKSALKVIILLVGILLLAWL